MSGETAAFVDELRGGVHRRAKVLKNGCVRRLGKYKHGAKWRL